MSRLEEVELTNMCMICDGNGNVLVSELHLSDKLIDGFDEMLSVFTKDEISEVFYERLGDDCNTVFC